LAPDGCHQLSIVGTRALAVTTAFTHDEFGRLTALDHTQGATSLAAYSWSYDAAGQLLEQSSPDGSVVYSYDLTGQLTGADWDAGAPLDDESYDYDLSGNRTAADGAAYSTGDRNQTTFDGAPCRERPLWRSVRRETGVLGQFLERHRGRSLQGESGSCFPDGPVPVGCRGGRRR